MRALTRHRFVDAVLKTTIVAVLLLGLGAIAVLAAFSLDRETHIYTVMSINRPIHEIFEYVTTPAHWPKWHPASRSVAGAADHSLEVGEQVTEVFVTAEYRGSIVWTVIDRKSPHYWVIKGDVVGSDGGGVITYTLSADSEGTKFERELVYSSPTILFYVMNKLRIQALITVESQVALPRLKQVLEKP